MISVSNAGRSLTSAPTSGLAAAQALSLDIVAGVVCAAWFAQSVTQTAMPFTWWVVLAVSTWLVYSLDHLADAWSTKGPANDFKHRFYQRHARGLVGVTLALTAIAAVLALRLPVAMFWSGILLVLAALVHLFAAQGLLFSRYPKELSAAVIYTAAIWCGPLIQAAQLKPWIIGLIGIHLLAALANLIVYSLFERGTDLLDNQRSAVRTYGAATTATWLRGITMAGVVLALLLVRILPAQAEPYLVALVVLLLTPATMHGMPLLFQRAHRYRTYGDLAFLVLALPAVFRL